MEWNDPVVGQKLHFGPFPFLLPKNPSLPTSRKSTPGVPKRWKANLHQICFSNPRLFWYHKGSPPVLFWDEKRPWLGRGGLLCGNSVPKFELDFCPDHWVGPFGPKLHETSRYIIHNNWLASKKSHFRTFAPLTPSSKLYSKCDTWPQDKTRHTLDLSCGVIAVQVSLDWLTKTLLLSQQTSMGCQCGVTVTHSSILWAPFFTACDIHATFVVTLTHLTVPVSVTQSHSEILTYDVTLTHSNVVTLTHLTVPVSVTQSHHSHTIKL